MIGILYLLLFLAAGMFLVRCLLPRHPLTSLSFRARAEAYYGDEWAQDPACYLTDEEIGLK